METTQQINNHLIKRQGDKDVKEWSRFVRNRKQGYKVYSDTDEMAPCDVLQIAPDGRHSYVELKQRNFPINRYPDCAVDLYKIQSLQRIAQSTGDKVFLAALYPQSGYIAIWQIKEEEDYTAVEMVANSKTVQFNGPAPKRIKTMVKLMLKDASIYTHQFERV